MGRAAIPGPEWIPKFLKTLKRTRVVGDAMVASGKTSGTVYFQRRRNQAFADAWEAALRGEDPAASAKDDDNDNDNDAAPAKKLNAGWRNQFIDMLAGTSNVTASARHANVPVATVYETRRKDAGFAARWRVALFEGYANLEMELLGHLRNPDPERKMDVGNALRLLAAHKETIAKERAVRANVSAAEVRASIERKVELLRKQVAAEKARAPK